MSGLASPFAPLACSCLSHSFGFSGSLPIHAISLRHGSHGFEVERRPVGCHSGKVSTGLLVIGFHNRESPENFEKFGMICGLCPQSKNFSPFVGFSECSRIDRGKSPHPLFLNDLRIGRLA